MAANPAPGSEYFTAPAHPNQRRHEAARLLHRGPDRRAGRRPGRLHPLEHGQLAARLPGRKLELFAPHGKPGPKTAPAKDRARARVTELRREGLSVHESSARLRAEGTPLNRTGVGQILAEEGFGWLLRGPAPGASASPATAGRDTGLPRAAVIDFAAFPTRAETRLAGLLLAVPDLVALDLPCLTRAAGYPGTSVIPAVSWLLSLLALKLTGTRRVSHVDDLLTDPASAFVRRAGRPAEEIRAHRGRSYQLSYLTWTCGNSLIVIRRPARSPGVGFGSSRARDGHAVVGCTLKSGKSQGRDRILAVQTGRNTYDVLSYLSSI